MITASYTSTYVLESSRFASSVRCRVRYVLGTRSRPCVGCQTLTWCRSTFSSIELDSWTFSGTLASPRLHSNRTEVTLNMSSLPVPRSPTVLLRAKASVTTRVHMLYRWIYRKEIHAVGVCKIEPGCRLKAPSMP